MRPVALRESSVANLTRWASPPDSVVEAANSASRLIVFPDTWEVDADANTISYGGATASFPEYYDLVAVDGGYVLELNDLALPAVSEVRDDVAGTTRRPVAVEDDAFVVAITLDSQFPGLWYRLEQYDPIDADEPCLVGDWVRGQSGTSLSIDRDEDDDSGFYRIGVTDVQP